MSVPTWRVHARPRREVIQRWRSYIRPVRLTYKSYFSANKQYFSLTTNWPTVLSAMTYQPSEQSNWRYVFSRRVLPTLKRDTGDLLASVWRLSTLRRRRLRLSAPFISLRPRSVSTVPGRSGPERFPCFVNYRRKPETEIVPHPTERGLKRILL